MTESVAIDKLEVGSRIRDARKEAGVSITKLAIAVDVDPRTVARWQADKTRPSYEKLVEIAAVLGKTPSYFLGSAA